MPAHEAATTKPACNHMRGKVYARIPADGLGNCLLVWAHALVFARLNDLELIVGRWGRFRPGAIMRRETKNRLYFGYFKETPIVKLALFTISGWFQKKVFDPVVEKLPQKNKFFIFTRRAADDDLFKMLVPYKDLIRSEILSMLSPLLYEKLLRCESPSIAVHIRRGDFKSGNPITPESFFISAIKTIRHKYGELPVHVFTDARKSEISGILAMNNVSLSRNKEDILDILQMSNSRFIVLSRSSTFSYWAAFLSDATIIMSEHDWQRQIKPASGAYKEIRVKE